MNRTRNQLFAHTCLALDKYRPWSRSDLFNRSIEIPHRLAPTDHLAVVALFELRRQLLDTLFGRVLHRKISDDSSEVPAFVHEYFSNANLSRKNFSVLATRWEFSIRTEDVRLTGFNEFRDQFSAARAEWLWY
jgi:hypothetical protein